MNVTTAAIQPPASRSGWRSRTLKELKAEQGITGPQDLQALIGAGTDLFRDDADFDLFLEHLESIRGEQA